MFTPVFSVMSILKAKNHKIRLYPKRLKKLSPRYLNTFRKSVREISKRLKNISKKSKAILMFLKNKRSVINLIDKIQSRIWQLKPKLTETLKKWTKSGNASPYSKITCPLRKNQLGLKNR